MDKIDIFDSILGSLNDGRVNSVSLGVIVRTDDPMQQGRVIALDYNGNIETDWLSRVLPNSPFSPPVPKVGQTVVIGYPNGDPNKGVYLGVLQNLKNPRVNQDIDFVLQVGLVTVTITPTGQVLLSGVTSLSIKPPIDTPEVPRVSIGFPNITFTDVESFSINGKEVATIDAVDSRGDTVVNKGW